ncbi:MAG: hypothetical protein ACYCPS_01825 [Candidatus Saccharimonadales bacterium]
MGRGKSPEVEMLVSQLETMARYELETPGGITTNMGYKVVMPDTFYMRFEDRADSAEVGYKGSGHLTAIFIEQAGEVHDEDRCSTQMAFSCLYDHDDQILHGVQFLSPADMPKDLPDGTPLEQIAYQRVLAVAQYIFDKNIREEDSIMEESFKVTDDALDENLRTLVIEALQSTSQLLAEGAFHERRFKKVGIDRKSLWVQSNTQSGPAEHADTRSHMTGQLSVSFTEDGITYTFEQTNDGIFEIKSKIADFAERYRYYRTFKPTFSDTGELVGFGINSNEIKEKEQEEREAGMYEPTTEKLNAFIERLSKAA